MRVVVADLWTYPADFRVVTTNGVITPRGLVMGAGVALQAKQRFPGLPVKLARLVLQHGNRVFVCHAERVISFPTKRHWREPSCLDLIRQSAEQLVQVVDRFAIATVALPPPGCGNGGLNWPVVRPILSRLFDDRFVITQAPD